MTEVFDMLLTLAQDIKTIKAYLLNFHKSRLEQFSDEWIDGQVVMQTLHISKEPFNPFGIVGFFPTAESMASSITKFPTWKLYWNPTTHLQIKALWR